MKSWKTTVAGIIVAAGGGLKTTPGLPAWCQLVGDILMALGSAAVGFFARDNNRTSEEVNAGKTPTP